MVANTRELLPEPETPVKTVSLRLGISRLTFFRLFSRAPWTRMRSCESAACTGPGEPRSCRSMARAYPLAGGGRFSIPDQGGRASCARDRHERARAGASSPPDACEHLSEPGRREPIPTGPICWLRGRTDVHH